MKIRRQHKKIALHRETVRTLDLASDSLQQANGGAGSSLCTRTHPHCDTVTPCIQG